VRCIAGLVLTPGFETIVNLLGKGIVLLTSSAGYSPSRKASGPNAVDELLRVDPLVLINGRMTTADTEVAGGPIPRGSVMVALLGLSLRLPRGNTGGRRRGQ
jgi:cytochrome P450